MHFYEVRPRKDKRGVDLISDVLPLVLGLMIWEANRVQIGVGKRDVK